MTAILPAGSCFSDFTNIIVYDSRDCKGKSKMARYDTVSLNPGTSSFGVLSVWRMRRRLGEVREERYGDMR
jgi:hypothetical protein